jgi:hypothetical protein
VAGKVSVRLNEARDAVGFAGGADPGAGGGLAGASRGHPGEPLAVGPLRGVPGGAHRSAAVASAAGDDFRERRWTLEDHEPEVPSVAWSKCLPSEGCLEGKRFRTIH